MKKEYMPWKTKGHKRIPKQLYTITLENLEEVPRQVPKIESGENRKHEQAN